MPREGTGNRRARRFGKSGPVGRLKPGLRFNILVYLGVMMLTAVILTSLVLFKITVTNFTQLEVKHAQNTILSIKTGLALLFEKEDTVSKPFRGFLQTIVNDMVRDLELETLVLVDAQLNPLAQSSIEGAGDPALEDLERAMRSHEQVVTLVQPGVGLFSSGVEELSVSVPITRGRRVLGGIKATFLLDELDRNIKITQRVLLSFVVASTVLIMAFGIYYLSRTVIWPIKKMVEVTGEFADGNLDAKVELTDKNELGYLADSFNDMAARIKERESELEENVRALEELNLDLRRTRTELISSEKRASVGVLAQGVAHEIGNPLSAVLGYLEILKKSPGCGEDERELIGRSDKEIARINEIITELLNYARPTDAELCPVDVPEVLNALVTLIHGQKRFMGIEIEPDVGENIPPVTAHRNRLIQVLVNLAFNAADAMQKGGRLEIGAAKRPYSGPGDDNFNEAGDLSKKLEKGDPVVEIWVKDAGEGIEAEAINRIFDPFFTTKDPGRGTGLGLAISSLIIEQFGARLTIESVPGSGSLCTITFILDK